MNFFCAKRWWLLCTACVACSLAVSSHAAIVISEFMADNNATLADGNGVCSDWIELHNRSNVPLDLAGYYLTDDLATPAKWPFPSFVVSAGSFRVVFASGQASNDYVDSLGVPHTTFKLSANTAGEHESLALVAPDGVTIVHSFTDYPPQAADVSYGLPGEVHLTGLVATGATASALIPSGPVADWTSNGFDDAAWAYRGTTAVGYANDTNSVYVPSIGLNVGAMFGVNPSVFIRIPFVGPTGDIVRLTLRIRYDDGFVATINGTKVAAANTPPVVNWNTGAPVRHDADPTKTDDTDLTAAMGLLVPGTNILAIQGLNAGVMSSDLLMLPELDATAYGAVIPTQQLYLAEATPGGPNGPGVAGYVEQPGASISRGYFADPFTVDLTTATAGASIYYSLDAVTPTATVSAVYTVPLAISNTTVLRAAAYKEGYAPSPVATYTYLFVDDVVTQSPNGEVPGPHWPAMPVKGQAVSYGMDPEVTGDSRYADQMTTAMTAIPAVSLVTDPGNLFDAGYGIYVNAQEDGGDWERPASFELLVPDSGTGIQVNAGLRIRGGVSRQGQNPKHSFRLFFRSEYGASKLKYPLFGDEGVSSFDKLDLRTGQNFSWNMNSNNAQYATWLYDAFSRDAGRDMGIAYSRARFYHLFLNGHYWGLYQTDERTEANFGESYFGGEDNDYDTIKSDNTDGHAYPTDGVLDGYTTLWAHISAGMVDMTNYWRVQGLDPTGARDAGLPVLLDAEELMNYMLLVYFTGNRDMPLGPPGNDNMPRNMYALYNRVSPRGVQFITHDAEHSIEIQQGVMFNRVSTTLKTALGTIANANPWWMHLQLVSNTEYRLGFADQIHRHLLNDGALTPSSCVARLMARAGEIDTAIIGESARWGDYLTPNKPRTRDDDWLPMVNRIVSNYFIANPQTRTEVVLDQFRAAGWYPALDAPVFSQHGGMFTNGFALGMSATAPIYYTRDGTDPRTAVFGTPRGDLHTNAVPLPWNVVVKARAFDGADWSALTEAVFTLDTPSPLHVTELMYHPGNGAGIETNWTEKDFEFVELQNTGTQTIGLAGIAFSGGLRFDFTACGVPTLASGAYVVLVNDDEAFAVRYTNDPVIAGGFTGRFFTPGALANDGESIVLCDGLSRSILDFAYDDRWYPLTDGPGYSLTQLDAAAPTHAWNLKASWRASSIWGGTPGYGDSIIDGPQGLAINELMALNTSIVTDDFGVYSDWIELHNAGATTQDLSGYFISDDLTDPVKCRLDALTLAPGGFTLLWADGQTNQGSLHLPFKLTSSGEQLGLFGPTALGTALVHSVSFGAQAADISFGLYPDATGEWFAMVIPTSGTNNVLPEPGGAVCVAAMLLLLKKIKHG